MVAQATNIENDIFLTFIPSCDGVFAFVRKGETSRYIIIVY
jgi:hypothetical protein